MLKLTPKNSLLLIGFILMSFSAQAQVVISSFGFDSLPLTSAASGPNAIAVNGSGRTGGSGVAFATGGPAVGLDLVVPGATFDVPSLDVVVEFARNENDAVFFERGGTKFFMAAGNLYFNYRVVKTGNSGQDYTLGPVSAPPMSLSGAYNTLRAVYDASTGEAAVFVGMTRVLYFDGPDSRDLHWHQAGDMFIGGQMDGGGGNFQTLGSITFTSGGVSALPVELVSFSAAVKSEGVVLKWKTATELNNYGFEVQRSADRGNWETLSFVAGHGTSYAPKSYSFTDAGALRADRPILFYRLRQIDRDGTQEYSSVLEVPMAARTTFSVRPARPNPFNPSTVLGIVLDRATAVSVMVYDATGREVARLLDNEALSEGHHDIRFNAMHLPSGVYFATVSSAQGTQTVTLVLQK
jgi:hypothetical protein